MVDSGVDSQHKSIFKERNISVTEDDECLSFSDRDKIVVSEEEDESERPTAERPDDKKDDSDEVSSA
jgi:hypothetical protein